MKVFKQNKKLRKFISCQKKDLKIGLVATMGALHEGHISLIKSSKKKCDITICSIFVNPTQFNDEKDFKNYPKKIEKDLKILEIAKCDIVYNPNYNDIYLPKEKEKKFDHCGLDKILEGKYRPGHFDGVATIVEKLLEIIMPDFAFFGYKDLQQLMVVKMLVKNKNIRTKIVGCETIREKNGLAMSSRNQLLSKEDFKKSSKIYQQLKFCKENFTENTLPEMKKIVLNNLNKSDIKVEYFEFIDFNNFSILQKKADGIKYAACIAVVISGVRLIDNIIL